MRIYEEKHLTPKKRKQHLTSKLQIKKQNKVCNTKNYIFILHISKKYTFSPSPPTPLLPVRTQVDYIGKKKRKKAAS